MKEYNIIKMRVLESFAVLSPWEKDGNCRIRKKIQPIDGEINEKEALKFFLLSYAYESHLM